MNHDNHDNTLTIGYHGYGKGKNVHIMHLFFIDSANIALYIDAWCKSCYNASQVEAMTQALKQLRKKKHLTQQEAADYLQVSLRSYKSYENDSSKECGFKYQYMIDRLSAVNPIDETHGILTLDDIRENCENVFKEYPVSFAYLFGSYAKSNAREDSDVDLLISTDVTGMKYYGLVEKIRTALQKKVDLLTTDQLKDNKPLIDEILRDGIRIYG